MTGGNGNDTYVIDNGGDVVTENDAQGLDTVQSSINYTLTANVENLTLTGINNINGLGNALNNTITGNSGNNAINGGIGADTMIGGAGNDTYFVGNSKDVVTEVFNQGVDTVYSSINYALVLNVENLALTGTATVGVGNSQNNIIIGNSANNILYGAAGNDALKGGLGADRFQFSRKTDGIDVVADLLSGTDKIGISAAGFGGGLVAGVMVQASQLLTVTQGSAATNASQRFIYNSTTGGLFFDADGSGAGFATQFAILSNKTTLMATDFMVV